MNSQRIFSIDPVSVSNVETTERLVVTGIPAPGTREVLERLDSTESRSMHGQMPIVWSSADGHHVYDLAGNKFIDFTSTIFVANVGHSNPKVKDAIRVQLERNLISSYAYATEEKAQYLDQLLKFAGNGFEKAFLLSAGTEAMDAVVKLIRLQAKKLGKRRGGVISFVGNWHGRTMGAQLLSTNTKQKEWIGFEDPNVHFLNFPLPWQVDESTGHGFFFEQLEGLQAKGLDFDKDLGGVVLETFQGWGALFYPNSFVEAAKEFCSRHQLLLAFDEMQSGFGRTGRRFGFEHYGVEPDLIACGKGMGGGVPISGVLGKGPVMDLPEIGNMSSTHSGNPLVTAAARAVLEVIESEDLVSRAREMGEVLFRELNILRSLHPDLIESIQGKGLIAAIIFGGRLAEPGQFASHVCELAMRAGLLLVHTGRESIKIGPPLTISEQAILEGVRVIRDSIEAAASEV
jgi:4-aminobutyrate aminotransferase / (S)-3-amino-2-methylpropionate transaminase / 5-aminovalerate transaminase